MSVLIKMKMPKSCYDCELIDIIENCPHYELPNEAFCQIPWLRKRRHESCPLIEVPPHGDLIDRGELLKNKQHYEYMSDEYYITVRDIEEAPAIIPADDPKGE